MSTFRCESMALCQLMLHVDAAFNCVSELGELGMAQFKDLNQEKPPHQKKYIPEIRRCEILERKLGFLMNAIKQKNIDIPELNARTYAASERELSNIEMIVDKLQKEIKMEISNMEHLMKNFTNLTQMKHLLKKTQTFFDQIEDYGLPDLVLTEEQKRRSTWGTHDIPLSNIPTSSTMTFEPIQISSLLTQRMMAADVSNSFRLKIVAGVISTSRLQVFEKMLFRMSRGNIYMKCADIEVPVSTWNQKEKDSKTVFLVFLQGDQLMNKMLKVCDGFHADIYTCPDSSQARRTLAMEVMTRLEELNIVLNQTQDHLFLLLKEAATNLNHWTISVMKAKAVFFTMNKMKFEVVMNMLIGEFWCPESELNNINLALKTGTARSGVSESSAIINVIPSTKNLPTYHKTNKFTKPLQDIINAYSISTYKEINPAIFSIITFPFLFSIMFGDIGHGLIIIVFAAMLIFYENKLASTVAKSDFNMVFVARYLILLIGIFSVYSGLMYNDIFSKTIITGGTNWNFTSANPVVYKPQTYKMFGSIIDTLTIDFDPDDRFSKSPYWFGLDPVWQMSHSNKVTFLNSFRMKLSVIVGVFHMLFGITLSFINHRSNNNWMEIYCMVIPQTIFLLSTFGYLVALIFHKWIYYDASQSAEAPALIVGFINMFLMNYKEDVAPPFYVGPGKKVLQIILLAIALLCVPWMLFAKPYILYKRSKNTNFMNLSNSSVSYRPLRTVDEDVRLIINSDEEDDQFNESNSEKVEDDQAFMDMFIYQCIHTIEFCLGCISHTASYLRLWALSLAHGQLSDVIWNASMKFFLQRSSDWTCIHLFFSFSVWASLTVVILLCMEGLSVFLHTLRLHWIEFMSKFYGGEGLEFRPFVLSKFDLSLLEKHKDYK